MKGIGFKSKRDPWDRYMLYKKSFHKRFPKKSEILDQLICMAILYGDSNKMAMDQVISLQREVTTYPSYKKHHEHPCDMPEKIII